MNVPAYGYDEIIKYINEKESDNLKFVKIDDNFYKKRIYAIGATHDGNIIICEENNKSVIYFKGKDINQLKQLLNSSALMKLKKENNGMLTLENTATNEKRLFFEKEEEQELTYLFNTLAKKRIKGIKNYKNDQKFLNFEQNNQDFSILIYNYRDFKNKPYFKELKSNLQSYNCGILAANIINKLGSPKVFNFILAGSLVTTVTSIGFTATYNLPDSSNVSEEKYYNTDVSYSEKDFIIPDSEKPIKDEPLNFDSNSSINIEIPEEENSQAPTELPNNDKVINYDTTDFSTLKNFESYDDYIRFAAKLYYLDYETAKEVVAQNLESFTSPYKNDGSELDRMKDLKQKGIIDGDLNVMGIFISIKNYTLDALNDQNPIISNKTNEEREADLINIARYIYGINDEEMLKSIIAIHRTETGYGKNAIATEHNNLGGIIDATSDYNNPKHYIYKTTEIGAESAIRNYLIVFDKCFYNDKCDPTKPIPTFIANLYCTHTPKEWQATVSELMEDVDINAYVNSESKSY